MSELLAYGHQIDSVFQLVGTLENDISKSIAWAMVKCPVFLKRLIKCMLGIDVDPDSVRIIYQQYEEEKGITDLEITDDDNFFVIVEAKRGTQKLVAGGGLFMLEIERQRDNGQIV